VTGADRTSSAKPVLLPAQNLMHEMPSKCNNYVDQSGSIPKVPNIGKATASQRA